MKKKAVALAYDHIGAPRVVAKGEGEIARRIIEIAESEGIPLQKDNLLVEALLQVEITKEIPTQLYQAVAEVLAFIYHLEKTANSKANSNM